MKRNSADSFIILWCLALCTNGFTIRRGLTERRAFVLRSSFGGGAVPPDDSEGPNGDWDDFLNPNGDESENLRRAREYFSEESLPISFESNANNVDGAGQASPANVNDNTEQTSAITPLKGEDGMAMEPTAEMLANNPYIKVVSGLSPSDLISKFTTNSHPRVQDAARRTILGLIGGLPKMAFETTTITTGQKLASLMFQLQMTGYMFKNAEWQLSLSQSLGVGSTDFDSKLLLLEGGIADDDQSFIDPLKDKVRGKLKVSYGPKTKDGVGPEAAAPGAFEVEVDAAAYMSELRSEVSQLRSELTRKRQEKEEALRKDLLMYIRTLPEENLRSLSNTISQDVLVAMKGLVNVVMAGIGDGEIGPDTVTEQSGEAMAQLCMWQLVVGYNLRELEVREEMKSSMMTPFASKDEGGLDWSSEEGGVME